MTVQDIFTKARITLRDEKRAEYSEDELMSYLSDSVEYLSQILSQLSSSYTRKKIWVTASPMKIPENYIMADSNEKDAKYYHDYIEFEKIPREFVYYARYTLPKRINEEVLIPYEFIPDITQNVINRALTRNEYSVAAEQRNNEKFFAAVIATAERRDGLPKLPIRKIKYEV